jgi:DNA-binding PadR family transcriptional regulator
MIQNIGFHHLQWYLMIRNLTMKKTEPLIQYVVCDGSSGSKVFAITPDGAHALKAKRMLIARDRPRINTLGRQQIDLRRIRAAQEQSQEVQFFQRLFQQNGFWFAGRNH